MNHKIPIKNIEAIFFDFDGVLTNNKVYVDQNGKESVECNRADGIAFEILNKLKIDTLIISTEKNPVVKARAKKAKDSFERFEVDQRYEASKEKLFKTIDNTKKNLDKAISITKKNVKLAKDYLNNK